MLQNMVIGDPPGTYDRILDFSTAVTGCLFFVPAASLLDELADGAGSPGASAEGPWPRGPATLLRRDRRT